MTSASTDGVSVVGKSGILGLGVLPAIATGGMVVVLPSISDAFQDGSNSLQIKMVSTALGLGMMIGAPIGGIVADYVGHRRVVVFSSAAFAVLGLSMIFATALWYLITARFVLGLVTGALAVGLATTISVSFAEKEQSRWLGYSGGAATLSLLVLMPLSGVLTDLGWHYSFTLYGLGLLVAAAIQIGIPAVQKPAHRPGAPGVTGGGWKAFPIKGILLGSVLGTLTIGTALYWPFRLRELGVESARELAFFGLPVVLATGGSALCYGWVRRRLDVMQVFLFGTTLSCASMLLMGLTPYAAGVALALVVEGLAVGLLAPNLSVYAIGMSGFADRGRNIGLVKGALYGSPFLTQFFLEPISRAGGPAMALCAIAAIAGLTALFVLPAVLRNHGAARPAL